jgi:hypothetical protein
MQSLNLAAIPSLPRESCGHPDRSSQLAICAFQMSSRRPTGSHLRQDMHFGAGLGWLVHAGWLTASRVRVTEAHRWRNGCGDSQPISLGNYETIIGCIVSVALSLSC